MAPPVSSPSMAVRPSEGPARGLANPRGRPAFEMGPQTAARSRVTWNWGSQVMCHPGCRRRSGTHAACGEGSGGSRCACGDRDDNLRNAPHPRSSALCRTPPIPLAPVAGGMGELEVFGCLGATFCAGADVVDGGTPFLPDGGMRCLETVGGHGLTAERAATRLRLPERAEERCLRGLVRLAHFSFARGCSAACRRRAPRLRGRS